MQIKSIVAGAAIALIAGVGSVSADEITEAATEVFTGTPFAMLDGIATEQLSVLEMAATRGGIGMLLPAVQKVRSYTRDSTSTTGIVVTCCLTAAQFTLPPV